MNDVILNVGRVSYSIAGNAILKDVSFQIEKGEMAAVLGPNGTGKSTLLKLISGDIQPGSGTIEFAGKDIKSFSSLSLAKGRAVLAQHTQISMDFSVEEIVLMGRYPHFDNGPSTTDVAIVKQALLKSSLQGMARRAYPSLSGGEKQRVNLSRVLAQIWEGMKGDNGKLLLLDEPLNNLDIEHQHQILETASEFASMGNAVIAVLHDLNMAARFADKLLLLSKPRLFASGSPEEVLTSENIRHAFNYPAEVCKHPFLNCPMVYYGCCKNQSETRVQQNLTIEDEKEMRVPSALKNENIFSEEINIKPINNHQNKHNYHGSITHL